MRLFMQPACQKLLRSKVYIASRSACLHTTPNIHAQAGSGGEMVADELRLRLKDKELLRLQAFIGGHWVSSKSSSSYEVKDPSTDETIAKLSECGASETTAAVAAASSAFPAWSKRTAKDRAAVLRRWYELTKEAQDDICTIMTYESGKPFKESQAEFVGGVASIEWFAEECRRIEGDILQTVHPDRRQIVLRQPLGVAASITPWNFPFSMITRKTAPAIAAGCTVVHKPAEQTPLTSMALAELGHRAGLPDGVFNVVSGDSVAIGNTLCKADAVRKIGFTGSTRVGKLLFAQAAETMKKVSMELGGNAPFIVFDDADVESAAANVVTSGLRNAGQTCICANRVFCQEGVYDAFVEAMVAAVKKLKMGGGMDTSTTLGPLISPGAVDRVRGHLDDAKAKGAKVLVGESLPSMPAPYDKGYFHQPAVVVDADTSMRIYREETFGPAMPVFKFKYDEEAIKLANDTEYGLAAYFFTKDLARAWKCAESLDYGMIGVNEVGITSEVAPFGGIKHSGLGREHGKYGIEEYLYLKYVQMGVGY